MPQASSPSLEMLHAHRQIGCLAQAAQRPSYSTSQLSSHWMEQAVGLAINVELKDLVTRWCLTADPDNGPRAHAAWRCLQSQGEAKAS